MRDTLLDEVLREFQEDFMRRNMVAKLPELLTVRQLADFLSVHEGTVRRWVRDGELPATKLPGGGVRIAKGEVLELLRPVPLAGSPRLR